MKELIEIPDSNVIANTEGCFGISFDGMDYQKIVMGGTPIPNNATVGDIIKAMFPSEHIEYKYDRLCNNEFMNVGELFRVDLDTWNAPYRKEKQ